MYLKGATGPSSNVISACVSGRGQAGGEASGPRRGPRDQDEGAGAAAEGGNAGLFLGSFRAFPFQAERANAGALSL